MFNDLFSRPGIISLIVGASAAGLSAAQKKRGATPLIVGGLAAGGSIWFLKRNPQFLQPINF